MLKPGTADQYYHCVAVWPSIAEPANRELVVSSDQDVYPVATGLNDRGQVLGQTAVTRGEGGFVWEKSSASGVWEQVALPNCRRAEGGINNAGQIAGNILAAGGEDHAALWQKSLGSDPVFVRDLGTAGKQSGAHGINENGLVVGIAAFAKASHGFLWGSTLGMKDLGALDGVYTASWAYDINTPATGPVQIVGNAWTSKYRERAVLWEWNGASSVIYDLNTLLETPLGWELTKAEAVNDDGWIAAYGKNGSGVWVGLILSPVP
jgi:probable HAF family extracellular repeat protein